MIPKIVPNTALGGAGDLARDADRTRQLGLLFAGDHLVKAHQDDLGFFVRIDQRLRGRGAERQGGQIVVVDLNADQEFPGRLSLGSDRQRQGFSIAQDRERQWRAPGALDLIPNRVARR